MFFMEVAIGCHQPLVVLVHTDYTLLKYARTSIYFLFFILTIRYSGEGPNCGRHLYFLFFFLAVTPAFLFWRSIPIATPQTFLYISLTLLALTDLNRILFLSRFQNILDVRRNKIRVGST